MRGAVGPCLLEEFDQLQRRGPGGQCRVDRQRPVLGTRNLRPELLLEKGAEVAEPRGLDREACRHGVAAALLDQPEVVDAGLAQPGAHQQTAEAAAFRPVVTTAIARTVSRTTSPPFVPIALDGGEPVHSPILHYRIGSYWNIIIGYTIGSGIFPAGSEQENWIPHYQERHGGVFLGMVRSGGDTFNFWTGPERVNPLYGTRYTLDALRRDEPERALLSLYGTLAQGLTRNTFVGGEGCTLRPVDGEGRFFYCPPNSAAFMYSGVPNAGAPDFISTFEVKPP